MFGLMTMIFATTVTADDVLDGVEFTSPDEGEWYADSIFAEWTNDESVDDMTLKYQEDSCDVGGTWNTLETDIDADESSFDWDVSAMEGNFCLRLQESDEYAFSGQFCVDNTDPSVDIDTEDHLVDEFDTSPVEGIESDFWTQDTGSHVQITLSDASQNGNEVCDDCELDWELDWGDGNVYYGSENDNFASESGDGVCIPNLIDFDVDFDCFHQYADSGDYEVTLTVYDCADNENSDSSMVHVENVVPECEILGPTDAAVGQLVYFDGIISNNGDYNFLDEVDADMPTMDYSWDFGDGNIANGANVQHTYSTDSFFDVFLTVDDGDGGVNTCHHEINVVEPTVLDSQEAAAFYPLEADFGEGIGPSFFTGFSDCEKINGPSNLRVNGNIDADDSCQVRWDRDISAHPTNDERGDHMVVIRASDDSEGVNGGSYEYFAFDITVWSWIIDLTEGWNLISIPLVPEEDNSIDTLILDQIFDSLPGGTEYSIFSYQYDGTDSEWLSSRRSGVGDLDTIMPGHAYWIKTIEDATIRGNGVTNDGINPYPSTKVPRNSWAMVGRYGIVGLPWKKEIAGNQYLRTHGYLRNPIAFDSLDAPGTDLNLRTLNGDGDLDIDEFFTNNEGAWLYVENNDPLNDVETYTPLDEWYPENNGLSTDLP